MAGEKLSQILEARGVMPVWENGTDWETRKAEIRELITDIEYGAIPVKESSVRFKEVMSFPWACGKAVMKRIEITAEFPTGEFTWPVTAFIPKKDEKVPFFVYISGAKGMPSCTLPLEEVIDRGFAVISYNNQDICVDFDMQKHDPTPYGIGVYPYLFPEWKEGEQTYGHIAVWSWGASKVLDWALAQPELDPEKSAVVGHSRLGKTALYAGMMDERFAYVIPNDSGCGGAAIYRGISGESWDDVVRNFPYWMGPKYGSYVHRTPELPFDQHFMVAACAPRKVYVSAADEDAWADYNSMFLCCVAASEVYEKLGLPGFVSPDRMPVTHDVFNEGSIGYHLRKGPHDMGREDWNRFMDFMEK